MRLVCVPSAFQIPNISMKLLASKTHFLVCHTACKVIYTLIFHISIPFIVAEKLKQEGRHEIFEQETMEELEDDEGNVYNRKTYDDLKKQGLI